jgi:hypothetical protein
MGWPTNSLADRPLSTRPAPEFRIGRADHAAVIPQPRPAIERQAQWSVEIDDLSSLRLQQRRRNPKRRANPATDHDPHVPPLRFRRQRKRLGQPTRFVELDIDRLVFLVEPAEIGKRPAGFVCAERDLTLQPRQPSSASAGSGCSISATLKSSSIGTFSRSCASFQLSLASTSRCAAGATCRTARTRSASTSPKNSNLSSGRVRTIRFQAGPEKIGPHSSKRGRPPTPNGSNRTTSACLRPYWLRVILTPARRSRKSVRRRRSTHPAASYRAPAGWAPAVADGRSTRRSRVPRRHR